MAEQTKGQCRLCGAVYNLGHISRHLKTCAPKGLAQSAEKRKPQPVFLISVTSKPVKTYWIHVAMPASARLSVLDRFLRRIWVECCDHLSLFVIDGEEYMSGNFINEYDEDIGSMEERARDVLDVGTEFDYYYDMGSTTELELRVLSLFDAPVPSNEVILLARNQPPVILCNNCGNQPAKWICPECSWRGKGWLCEECARTHDCDYELDEFLPVVNSPRVGVCGYTGGREEYG